MKKINLAILALGLVASVGCSNNRNETAGTDSLNTVSGTNETAGTDDSNGSNASTAAYVDLSTGNPISVTRDVSTGYYVNADTRQPVEFYVDVNTRDTIYGRTGLIANNVIIKGDDGAYKFDESKIVRRGDDIKIKNGETKIKMDDEGDMKIKDQNSKTKITDDTVKTKPKD